VSGAPLVRFKAKVRVTPAGCWLWTGAGSRNGSPVFWTGYRHETAARWAYRYFNGTVRRGATVYRTCGRRTCVNPRHLRLRT
jgi:hypothetical protein